MPSSNRASYPSCAATNLNGVQYIATAIFSSTGSRSYVNGCLNVSSSTVVTLSGTNGFYIGSRQGDPGRYFNGYIAELLYYRVALSPTQQVQVESYLASKWSQDRKSTL